MFLGKIFFTNYKRENSQKFINFFSIFCDHTDASSQKHANADSV